ncbi:MAG: hypothetical protein HY791_20120 [Deltaproteobacteria bacterium]|nr:hypothetical protein [Deltaproteobacteria bacterium]
MSELAGRTIAGRYRVGSLLSQGRGGTTYSAVQTGVFEREVLIELISGPLSQDRVKIADVARRVARLRHSAAITPTDSGELEIPRRGGSPESRLYFVRPPLLALSLEEKLAREGVVETEAIHFATELAECLEEAHQNGVSHGAISLSGVWVEPVASNEVVRLVFEVAICATCRPGSLGYADDLFGFASILEAFAVSAKAPTTSPLSTVAKAIRDGNLTVTREARRRLFQDAPNRRPDVRSSRSKEQAMKAILAESAEFPTIGSIPGAPGSVPHYGATPEVRADSSLGTVGFDSPEELYGEEQTEEEQPGFGSEETETEIPGVKKKRS